MLKIIRFTLIAFLFNIAVLLAQQQINLTNFSSTNRLSQNTVFSCFKDQYGLMWFGTQDGLNMFDGYKVTIYKPRTNNPKTIAASYITSIGDDKQGDLWIGTRLGGLSKYSRSTNTFLNFRHDEKLPNSISNNNIKCVYRDKKGNIWIGTENGLNLLDAKSGNFKRFYFHKGNSSVFSIYEDRRANLWIGTSQGLILLNVGTGKSKAFTDQLGNSIFTIFEDGQGKIWMGTDQGLKVLNEQNGSFTPYAVTPDLHSEDRINPVFCSARKDKNSFWLGTNTTLQLFDTEKKKLIPISDRTIGDDFMPNDGIYSLLSDHTNTLWVGTTSQGVLKYDPNLVIFPSYMSSLATLPSAKNIIRAVAEDEKRNLYIATDVGLSYFDRGRNAYTHLQHQRGNKNSIASDYTTAMLVSKQKKIWIGTYSSGLDCFDPKTKIFKHYTFGSGAHQLSSNLINVLLEDRKGNIWIGTNNGINVLDVSTGTFTKYFHQPNHLQSLSDNEVQALYEDKSGN
ncbi:MAG: hypothetical protein H7325_07425, partial [Pedobacter sp.]|nr:hypothetical protein [Pedobacter sp.]